MSQMEDSLRRALDGGDASDPAFRESIYAASERALERMLATREADEAVQLDQRSRLADTINRVEADYAALHPGGAHEGAGATPDGTDPDEALGPAEFDDGTGDRDARAPRAYAPDEADAPAQEDPWTPGGTASAAPVPAPRRHSIAVVVAAAVVFALLLAVLAYAVAGAVRSDATAPAETPVSEGAIEDADPDAASALPALAWIDVFDGNDLDALATPNGGRIETIAKPDEREAVRVSAPAGAEGEVLLAVGAGIMRQISGHQVRIELTAGSPDGQMREFGIRCLTGDASYCDRQRFSTAMPEEAFVFDVAVPSGQSAAGSIAIGPGLNGTSNDVDIYAVRLLQLD
ncbi:hypothetical protein [Aureimonas sp. AU12]|uniref:hypothetical protein n=1 Tax=Aureimonas sp. AU12 TaxID=1638161 RepID=UPI000A64C334|nr:hypothetical protein [Aureimonas sp. AU12]